MTYQNHPGFDARDCPARVTVNAHPMGLSSNGYACGVTGGHCLPCDKCPARRIVWERDE
jgi:hypothetical protein